MANEAGEMVRLMQMLAEWYREHGEEPPSPWMGRPDACPLCTAGRFPHLHRSELVGGTKWQREAVAT